jgi:hypothetical protein
MISVTAISRGSCGLRARENSGARHAGHRFAGHDRHAGIVRPAVLNRTFGCVRVVWNRTMTARHEQYATGRKGTSFA